MKREKILDIIKGFCIIFVIITHYAWSLEERKIYLFPYWIEMAVPIFMILSGYVYTKSFVKKGIKNLEEAYKKEIILKSIERFTFPYGMIFVVEIVLECARNRYLISPLEVVKLFLSGGGGPGSYYYPIMIQFVFLFPVIYRIVKVKKVKGVMICAFGNFVYELFHWAYDMNVECYRLLIFRYTLLIAVGCYLATTEFKMRKVEVIIQGILGGSFLFAFEYLNYSPQILIHWTGTSFLASLFAIPILVIIVNVGRNGSCRVMELVGKASYSIFLVQKVYYEFIAKKIYIVVESRMMEIFINLICCVMLGLLFYYFEGKLREHIKLCRRKYIE